MMRRTSMAFAVVIILVLVVIQQQVKATHELTTSHSQMLTKLDTIMQQIDQHTVTMLDALHKTAAAKPEVIATSPADTTTAAPSAPAAKPEASVEKTTQIKPNTPHSNYQEALAKARRLLEQQRMKSKQPSTTHFTIAPSQPNTVQAQPAKQPQPTTLTQHSAPSQQAIPTPQQNLSQSSIQIPSTNSITRH